MVSQNRKAARWRISIDTTVSYADFTHRALIVVVLVMLAALVAVVIAKAVDVLLVLFGGILLAVLLRGLADLLSQHTPIPKKASLALVMLVLLVVLGSAVWLLATQMADQLEQLGANLGQVWQQIEERLRREGWGRQLLALVHTQSKPMPDAEVTSRLEQAFSTTLGGLVNFAIILFIGVYVAVNPGWYQRGLLRLIAPVQRPRAREILSAIGHTLRWWLFGRVVGMTIVGVLTTLGLSLLDVPLALGLGFVAAAVPGVLVALGGGLTNAAYVALLYLGIQIVEGYVLTPLIEQRSVRLPPALTIGAHVLLGVLVGALGVVFATPLTAVLVLLIKRLYVHDTLEQTEVPP